MNALLPASELKPHKMTVDELLLMETSGALSGLPRMELLEGVLYEMSPQTSRHVFAKNELGYRIRRILEAMDSPLATLLEPTLRVSAASAPEPDIAVVTQWRVENYYPAEIVKLAIEIAITTVGTDLRYKKALYAGAGIAEYWVVEIEAARIHQFWSPKDETYSENRIVDIGASLTSATIAGLEVATDDLI